MTTMRILQGTVVNGHIVVEGADLKEGSQVTVVDEGDETPYVLTPEQAAAIEAGEEEIDRGEFVTPAQLFAEMKRARGDG